MRIACNLLTSFAALVLLATSARAEEARPSGFVDASTIASGLVVEMRYFGTDNFIGRRIDGYQAPVCILTREAATALAGVQQDLAPFGLGLKAFDCYRPQRAVADFISWAADPKDQAQKSRFYPKIDKRDVFKLGYVAERSGHSRGSTIDLTLVDRATGREIDMGGAYDLFDPISWPTAEGLTSAQRAHRLLLRASMRARGFRPYDQEWWHFTLENEPFPDAYFDFPVAAR